MRIDERRVAEGKASTWRAIRGKGPIVREQREISGADGVSNVEANGGNDNRDDLNKLNDVRFEREIQNLAI